MGHWSKRVNGHDLHGFEGNTSTTYAVYNDRGRCIGDYETYEDAYAACFGLPVVDLRELVGAESGTIRPATLVGLLFALVPLTLLVTFSARLAGMLAGTVGGVA